ncbi:MAG: phage portal protein [Desulfarculaceae bacterium]|nr:phage portal protein [Desulfarculaceae bacterium]MCF8072578.1 phage portal protein [Desulfarculaceae bacterium]MCF8103481.1 phage portal protein [Desulfarculaceae bacterium]MCF8117501.1 phage portal protein [Desulfarculaceae bacterium]
MKSWLSNRFSMFRAKRLDLPPAPSGPPPFLGGSATRGRSRQLAAYQGWVFAAVGAIARRMAGMPLRLFAEQDDGNGLEVNQHPVLELLKRPNPLLTGRQLRYTLCLHLELTGMAFVLVLDNALGRPAELWPLNPADLIEISAGGDTRQPIERFVFADSHGERVSYAPGRILYFRHPSPTSLVYGASPVEAVAHAYDIDLAVRIYQRNFFRNSARPEVVLSTDQRLTEDEARRVLTRWRQKHQGLAHVFEPTVLDGGLKATPLTYSAKDFEFMDLAGWTQDNILAAYGVPAGKLGLVKDVNRANAQGIEVTFNAECIRPRLELWEDVLNAFLLPRYGAGLALRHDNPVPSDRAQAHREAMAQLDRGVITINELRAAQGRAPVAWGHEPLGRAEAESPLAMGLAPELAASLKQGWPRLEARFAGWSSGRVAKELDKNPALLEGLLPGHLPAAQKGRLRARLKSCLTRGLNLEQTKWELGSPRQGDES